ncbi:SMNDC1 [Bugula neritina]|uniref:SMNDC1 n=1 Tax=Bugula neritina TaxID=10212 RepID=A0A7J7J4Z2_BUGNE|nr:SMNDC1 [Bugula neritina]
MRTTNILLGLPQKLRKIILWTRSVARSYALVSGICNSVSHIVVVKDLRKLTVLIYRLFIILQLYTYLNSLNLKLEPFLKQFGLKSSYHIMATNIEQFKVNLATYVEQLSQVDAALTVDPENEELTKLKTDLAEVIELTEELIRQNAPANETQQAASAESSAASGTQTERTWSSGDKCMAIWSNDGQYYPCTVDEILEDGTCSVNFEGYNQSEVTQVSSLQPYDPARAKETRNKLVSVCYISDTKIFTL